MHSPSAYGSSAFTLIVLGSRIHVALRMCMLDALLNTYGSSAFRKCTLSMHLGSDSGYLEMHFICKIDQIHLKFKYTFQMHIHTTQHSAFGECKCILNVGSK